MKAKRRSHLPKQLRVAAGAGALDPRALPAFAYAKNPPASYAKRSVAAVTPQTKRRPRACPGWSVGGYCHAQCFAAIKEASSTHWTPKMSHVSWRTQTDPARVFFCGANMLVHVLYTSCSTGLHRRKRRRDGHGQRRKCFVHLSCYAGPCCR